MTNEPPRASARRSSDRSEPSTRDGEGARRRFVGVDLATEAKRTGVAIITLDGKRATASLPSEGFCADDRGLVEIVDRATVVGLDSPLGWPDDFVSAVTAHRMSARWPTLRAPQHRQDPREPSPPHHRPLCSLSRPRLDAVVGLFRPHRRRGHARGVAPVCLGQTLGRLEPRDGTGRLVETYPAAALRAWSMLARRGVRYKGGGSAEQRDTQRAERERIMSTIAEQSASWLVVEPALRDESVDSDHSLDALVSALVALAACAGATYRAPSESKEAARREGWIHVPSETFTSLGTHLPSD